MRKIFPKLSRKFWFIYIFFSSLLINFLYNTTIDYIKLNGEKYIIEDTLDYNSAMISNNEVNLDKFTETEEIIIQKSLKNLISEAVTYSQFPNYPTGCESVALYILLKYYDVEITPNDIINNLNKGVLPYYENGILYGGNPELEFIGNPYTSYSYGVYNKPLADVANLYKEGINSEIGMDFSKVLELIDQNRPVLVWNTIRLSAPYISTSWIYKPTGEVINWISGEHAVVVIGYNDYNIIVSDPYTGMIEYYDRTVFIDRYNYLGKRALYY